MNRKTLTAFAAFAVLGLITLFTLRQPDKGETRGERPRPLPRLKAGDFDTLAVVKGGATSVLKKEGDKYQLIQPINYRADENAAKQAFEAIEKMEFTSIVTDQKAKQAEFEVDDKGLHVTVKKGDTVLADMMLGKTQGPGTMIRPSGKDEIWVVSGVNKYTFDKAPSEWRDKSVTTFAAGDAEGIDIKSKTGGTISLKKAEKKEGVEEAWNIAASSVKIDHPDKMVAGGIVATLSGLKAAEFADSATPQETGLADPALSVTVGLKGGKTATMLIGNKKGDEDWYVKAGDAPQVYLVKKFNMDRVNKRPIEFKDKTVCDIADGDLTEVAVSRGADSYTLVKHDGAWKASKPAKLDLDPAKATNVAGAFKDLKAGSFAEDNNPKGNGLDKPKATVVAKGKKASCTLKVGDETKDKQNYNVTTAASPDVLLVPKWSVDRMLVKVDDLKKAAVAKAAAPGGPPPGSPHGQ